MARFEPLGDGFDPALELPLEGADGKSRIYRIEPPNAELGLWTRRKAHLGMRYSMLVEDGDTDGAEQVAKQLNGDLRPPGCSDDDPDPELVYLGDALARMQADGVPWPAVQHAARTAMIWVSAGEDDAARYWASIGGSPEASAPNRATRRASARSTGGATTTKKPDSGNGTNSRKTSSRAKATKPRGTKS